MPGYPEIKGSFVPTCPVCKTELVHPWYELCENATDGDTAQFTCSNCEAEVEFKVHVVPQFDTRVVREPPELVWGDKELKPNKSKEEIVI